MVHDGHLLTHIEQLAQLSSDEKSEVCYNSKGNYGQLTLIFIIDLDLQSKACKLAIVCVSMDRQLQACFTVHACIHSC